LHFGTFQLTTEGIDPALIEKINDAVGRMLQAIVGMVSTNRFGVGGRLPRRSIPQASFRTLGFGESKAI